MGKTRKQRRSTTRRRGGTLLAQGAYGCAFRPALPCSRNTKNRPGQISKLMDGKDAVQELKQRDLFYGIDPNQKYFLYPFELCDPKMPFRPSDNVKKCQVPMKLMKILQSLDGGQSIGKILLTRAQYPAFFSSLSNLFNGLAKAHNNGIVHNDIKPDNIVSVANKDGTFSTRFIDFGLSFRWDQLDSISKNVESPLSRDKSGHSVFDLSYHYWSVEIHFVNPHPFTNKKTIINEFYKDVVNADKSIPQGLFYKTTEKGQVPVIDEAYLTWLESTLNKMPMDERYAIILTKDDTFALGLALAEVFYHRFGQRDNGKETVNIFMEFNPLRLSQTKQVEFARDVSTPFYKLIRRMIYPDIRKRISIEEAGKLYKATVVPAITKFFASPM